MDPHSFIARAEAQRWIGIAEKLLIGHDFVGSKTFAIRARDSDSRLEAADQILAIIDTLIASEKRVGGNNGTEQPDYYAILQLDRFVQDTDHIDAQYRRLAVMLNPHQNRFPYSDQAFQLVNDAWQVLSNPTRKSMYDSELDFPLQMNPRGFNLEQHQHQHNFFSIDHIDSNQTFQPRVQENQQLQQHNFLAQNPVRPPEHDQLFQNREHEPMFEVRSPHSLNQPSPAPQPPLSWPQPSPSSQSHQQQEHQHEQQHHHHNQQQENPIPNPPNPLPSQVNCNDGVMEEEQEPEIEEKEAEEDVDDSPTFWTTCPYCFYMYEYPKVYAECTLRCDNCKRAFQAVRIPSPPSIIEGKETSFYCWGFFPLGVSISHLQKNNDTGKNSKWTPFSPLYDVSKNVKTHLNDKPAPKKNVAVKKNAGPRVYIDDDVGDDIFMGISDPSDDSDADWNNSLEK